LVGRLAAEGYAVSDGLLGDDLVCDLLAELLVHEASGGLEAAGIGRQEGRRLSSDIRRAAIRWLDGATEGERRLFAFADALRLAINRQLFLGLFDFECHFIAYPVGGFYGRHLDSLAGRKNRVVSLVAYLDPDWRREDGGALRLWRAPDAEGEAEAEVIPTAGRVVLMLSEQIPHEVLPARRPRHAIAGWWRVNAS
jgi:SM-20-related protein